MQINQLVLQKVSHLTLLSPAALISAAAQKASSARQPDKYFRLSLFLFFFYLWREKNFLCRHIWEFRVVSFWSKCSALQDLCASGARFCPSVRRRRHKSPGWKSLQLCDGKLQGQESESFDRVLSLSLSPANTFIVSRLPKPRLLLVSGVLCCAVWMWLNVWRTKPC